MSLENKSILITGAAHRMGKSIAIAAATQRANIILHYRNSLDEVQETAEIIQKMGQTTWTIQADLSDTNSVARFIENAYNLTPIFGLINNASIFMDVNFLNSSIEDWDEHMRVNLTAPFILTQKFASLYNSPEPGRIINLLDWRALRPGRDHFPYTISKAGLFALTKATALSLAPRICVNAIALGAILPPENEPDNPEILRNVPMKRWATLEELTRTVIFLLDGPEYITGEIIHLDGGRHLV